MAIWGWWTCINTAKESIHPACPWQGASVQPQLPAQRAFWAKSALHQGGLSDTSPRPTATTGKPDSTTRVSLSLVYFTHQKREGSRKWNKFPELHTSWQAVPSRHQPRDFLSSHLCSTFVILHWTVHLLVWDLIFVSFLLKLNVKGNFVYY